MLYNVNCLNKKYVCVISYLNGLNIYKHRLNLKGLK